MVSKKKIIVFFIFVGLVATLFFGAIFKHNNFVAKTTFQKQEAKNEIEGDENDDLYKINFKPSQFFNSYQSGEPINNNGVVITFNNLSTPSTYFSNQLNKNIALYTPSTFSIVNTNSDLEIKDVVFDTYIKDIKTIGDYTLGFAIENNLSSFTESKLFSDGKLIVYENENIDNYFEFNVSELMDVSNKMPSDEFVGYNYSLGFGKDIVADGVNLDVNIVDQISSEDSDAFISNVDVIVSTSKDITTLQGNNLPIESNMTFGMVVSNVYLEFGKQISIYDVASQKQVDLDQIILLDAIKDQRANDQIVDYVIELENGIKANYYSLALDETDFAINNEKVNNYIIDYQNFDYQDLVHQLVLLAIQINYDVDLAWVDSFIKESKAAISIEYPDSGAQAAIVAIDQQIQLELANGLAAPNAPPETSITQNTTLEHINKIIWENSAEFEFTDSDPTPGMDLGTDQYLNVEFYSDPLAQFPMNWNAPLKSDGSYNDIYFRFVVDPSYTIYEVDQRVNHITPFTIVDTTIQHIYPTEQNLSDGRICVESTASNKLKGGIWKPSTTFQVVANDIESNCAQAYGVKDKQDWTDLYFYNDIAATSKIEMTETLGSHEVNTGERTVWLQWEVNGSTPSWWIDYSFEKPESFTYYTTFNVYKGQTAVDAANAKINSDISTFTATSDYIAYQDVQQIVNKYINMMVLPVAATSFSVKLYDPANPTVVHPNDGTYIMDGGSVLYDLVPSNPTNSPIGDDYRYTFSGMTKQTINIDWDSTYNLELQAKRMSDAVVKTLSTSNAVINETYLTVAKVVDDSTTYQDIVDAFNNDLVYFQLFPSYDEANGWSPTDALTTYVDKSSLVLREDGFVIYQNGAFTGVTVNGQVIGATTELALGEHQITFEYGEASTSSNCSWYDVPSSGTCHGIDGVELSGLDGNANRADIKVFHVIETNAAFFTNAHQAITTALVDEADADGNGYIDAEFTYTYADVINFIEQQLVENHVLVNEEDADKMQVSLIVSFTNGLGRPDSKTITSSEYDMIFDQKINGFYYTVSKNPNLATSPWTAIDNTQAYQEFWIWQGAGWRHPVISGTIYGVGVLYWLIIGAFILLIIIGILVAVSLRNKSGDPKGQGPDKAKLAASVKLQQAKLDAKKAQMSKGVVAAKTPPKK